ncbi:MAG: choice-of-anchor D domain-containing protein [Terriglobia bacterium]
MFNSLDRSLQGISRRKIVDVSATCGPASARQLLATGIALLLFFFCDATRGSASQPATPVAKLATVLADLAQAVSPTAAPGKAQRAPAEAGFSLESMPKSVRDAVHGRHLRINTSAEVQVYILMTAVTDENLRQLAAQGVTVEIADVQGGRVQARVPVTRLEAVAALPFVNFIRPPSYAVRMTGSVTTEGDTILRTDQVRSQLKLDGTGVRVGVISDGIKGIFATGCTTCSGVTGGPISSLDLPPATGTRNTSGVLTSSSGGIVGRSFVSGAGGYPVAGDLEGLPSAGCGFAGAGAEGTALLEIVHDLAPGAQLSFANADTDMAMSQAVNYLAGSNDVVVDDLGFLGLPSDGTSGVSVNTANALNNNTFPIRGYYTAVGNFADEHYYGLYMAGISGGAISSDITAAGNVHQFTLNADTTDAMALGPQPFNVVALPANGEVVIFLSWDDPFGSSNNNYDLYLVQASTGKVVARSTNAQSGTQDPVEFIDYVNNTGAQDYFHIVVQNVGNTAQPKHLNLFSFEPECATAGPLRLAPPRHERLNFNTPTRALLAQSDAGGSPVSVTSVGAICSASSIAQNYLGNDPTLDESCFDTTNSTIEFFSTQGPTLDGRNKPDVSAIDGVSVTGAGSFPCDATDPSCHSPFFGTSAAVPHVAGVAALLLQAAPCLLDGKSGALGDATARTDLRNLILDQAVPLGGTIPNNTFGSGRADALASADQTLPIFSGQSTMTVNGSTPAGVTLSPTQLGFADPNTCPLTTLDWTGIGCGTGPAAAMNCSIGINNISVSASNNGVSYPPAAAIQITVTDFSVAASPSAPPAIPAGQSLTFSVTVSPQYGAYTQAVTLSCANLPPETSCSFNLPTVTPASAQTSMLTLSTVPRPAAAPPSNLLPPQGWLRRSPSLARWHGTPAARYWPVAVAAVLLILLVGGAATRHRFFLAGAAAIMFLAFFFQVACGGGSSVVLPAPSASLTPGSLTFNSQPVGYASAAQTVTLTNSGNAALSITRIAASGDFAETNACGASLAAGANCAISVTFTPSTGGTRSGTLTITDNAAGSPHTVTLTGTGTPGTLAGTYNIDVTGTAGALVHSSPITLMVQ